jgi:hypothetical protein
MSNIEEDKENIEGYLTPDEEDNNYEDVLKLVSLILSKNGIGNNISSKFSDINIDDQIAEIIEENDFDENFEQAIIDFWEDSIYNDSNIFIENFINDFHYSMLEDYAESHVASFNTKITDAFNNIVNSIFRVNEGLEEDELATSILVDSKDSDLADLYQIYTPYSRITLTSDNTGSLYIVVFVDYDIIELLDINIATLFLRNIFKFTEGDISPYCLVGGLNIDCQSEFVKHKNASSFQENYKVYLRGVNTEESNLDKVNFDYSYLNGEYTCNLTDHVWNEEEQKYLVKKAFDEKAYLMIEEKTIKFKRPDNDWLMVSITFDRADVDKDKLIFHDNFNQKLLLEYDKTKLIWFYEFDGNRYLSCEVYSSIN